MMDGSAGVTSVWFNTVTKAPNTNTANISHSLRDNFIFYLVCYSSLACASRYTPNGADLLYHCKAPRRCEPRRTVAGLATCPQSFGSSDLKAEPKRQRTEGPRPGGRKATAL